ncbi:hypothetical protein ACS0TY_013163 [Phlomoides rotata]
MYKDGVVCFTDTTGPCSLLDFGSEVPEVESILDKEDFTLEELLDEDEIIQECKALRACLEELISSLNLFDYIIKGHTIFIYVKPVSQIHTLKFISFNSIQAEF